MNKRCVLSALFLGLSLNLIAVFAGHDQPAIEQSVYSVEDVVSVDAKYVNNTVHLLLGKKIKDQGSLWYQSSSDQGQTWSNAVNITEGQKIQARFHRGNDARLAVQDDTIAVVWMSKKEGAPHSSGPMKAMVSHDAGQSWKNSESPADWQGGSHGFFAMDADNEAISLAWLDSRKDAGKGAAQGLQYARSTDGGETWSANQTLDDRSCACCWNTAHYYDGDFYVMYRDKDPSDMSLGRIDSQQQWQNLSTVGQFNWDFQGCPHIGGSFSFDEKHQAFHAIVGTGHEKHSGAFYLNSADMGQTWSEPVRLGDETAVHSDIAVTGSGELLATWDHITETGFQIVYARSADQGKTWSTATRVSSDGARATHPRVIAMEDRFLLLWTEGKEKQASVMRTRVLGPKG